MTQEKRKPRRIQHRRKKNTGFVGVNAATSEKEKEGHGKGCDSLH